MENFVIIKTEKSRPKNDFEKQIDALIEQGHVVCVYGGSGVGKTHSCDRVLKEYSFIDFNSDILKSRKETLDLLSKIVGTSSVLYFDDIYTDSPGFATVVQFLEEGKHTTGPILFTIRNIARFEKHFKNVDVQYLNLKGPNKRNEIISAECMNRFNLKVSETDNVYSTRDNIIDLVCKGGDGYKRFIGKGIEEHGHNADLIFSNYDCDDIHSASRIIDSLSSADVYDDKIYEGNWDFLPYFTLHSCVVPSKIVGNTIDPKKIVPGTCWTKLYNQKMREKQYTNMKSRSLHSGIDMNFVSYFMKILTSSPLNTMKELCESYTIRSQDIDMMNHLVGTKLKGRNLNNLKRHLKQHAQHEVRRLKDHRG